MSLGFVACGETEGGKGDYDTSEVQPYVIASPYPVEGRNDITGIIRQIGTIGNKPYIKVETPNLEGWYVTYTSDNENMLTVDENGKCEVWRGGTVYVTVTYTNGIDKVTDVVTFYNYHWNRDIDLFFRDEGMDSGDYMMTEWNLSVGDAKELKPILAFSSGLFYDAIIESVTITDESVLSYENGVLTPLKAGKTDIVIDCSWRGYNSTSWDSGDTYGTGSADLKRTITVTVS